MDAATLDAPLPLRCGLTLPNRCALAPLTNRQSASDGTLGDDELRWLRARAHGGFGLISTCAAYISDEGKAWDGQLGIASPLHLDGLRCLATALREAGAAPIVQLHHAGKLATLAPGARLSTVDGDGVRGATHADLERVMDAFVAAAERAQTAGFVGVEIHGANGYLFTQFLAPHDNPRTDRWGGDLAGRARLLRQTIRRVRAAVGPDFALFTRISPVDVRARRGLVLADAQQLAAWLSEDGLDGLHLSLQHADAPPPHEPDAPPVVQAIRQALPAATALLVAGGIWTRDDAQRALDAGADVVAIGRAAIIHADWPRASAAPDFRPNRPPWTREALHAQAVGPALTAYLAGFDGLLAPG